MLTGIADPVSESTIWRSDNGVRHQRS